MTNPLKYHGGKHYLANWIIGHFPDHIHYVEPYFGGGAVMFAKPVELVEGHSEVANDLDTELMDFWHALQNELRFEKFVRLANMTPVSHPLWEASEYADMFPEEELEWRALMFFVRFRQSRQALGNCFCTLSRNRTRGGMNEQVSSWLSAVEGLPEFHDRLKRVVILNYDALDVIKQQDGPNTFFYLDPPYLRETRVAGEYKHEMSDEDHRFLLDALSQIKGKFLLSGNPSVMYDAAAIDYNWKCVRREIDNKASSKKVKGQRTECLWANYELTRSDA